MKEHRFKQVLLGKLKGRNIPKIMLFTDTETKTERRGIDDIQVFRLGWVFLWKSDDGMKVRSVRKMFFDDPVKYCQVFEEAVIEHRKIVICGHNIFFDLQCAGFFEYFTAQGWELDWLYDKGVTYILEIKTDKLSITAISTTNYFDCSLEKLGNMIGLQKKEISFDNAAKAQLKSYCYRDTDIVMRAIWHYITFIKDNDLGRFAFTKASQSMIAYRTRFMHHDIYLHEDERAISLERGAYSGGRTEAFRLGQIPGDSFCMLDVNGMYPYVMQKYKYPSKMVCYMEGEKIHKYTELLGGYGMVALVELNTPEPAFGCRFKGKLIFPTGHFQAYLCTEGLRYALNKGYIDRFIRASVYIMKDLFSDYVRFFQNKKLLYNRRNNEVMEKLCKYMHNSFYGKWGAKEIIEYTRDNNTDTPYLRREIWDAVCKTWWMETYFMNRIIMQHYEGEAYHAFPAIAAHVTENARLVLWEIISSIGRDKVLYCDTDSVIIEEKDLSNVTWGFSDKDMGGLKLQDRSGTLRIDGVKNYRTDTARHIKGIPEKAVEKSPGVFTYDSFEGQISTLTKGQMTGVKVTSVTRELKHKYDKGVVGKDGKVTPYNFTFFEPLP